METMALDHRRLPRLRASGLLPLARLVEGDRPRFGYDFSLPAALVDGWRSETHTFHLTVGEMAPTLRDVSYLLGLPLRGDAMGPTDAGDEYEIAEALGGLRVVVDGLGDVLRLRRQLCAEAPTPFARYVADAPPEAIPQFSRGSAVLAATYRGLCTGCLKSSERSPSSGGVRYFAATGSREVSDWSARGSTHAIPSGVPDGRRRRPDNGLYVVRPTSMCLDHLLLNSCVCLVIRINIKIECFPEVLPRLRRRFDVLRDDEVRWEPYSREAVDSRAPEGLVTAVRTRREYRRTRSPPVFDIYVEEHAVHRVLRQFGLFQEIVVPASLLPPHAHRFTRQDQSVGQLWIPRLAEFVARWTTALDDVVMEGRPHDDAAWGHYLRWYLPRTRVRVLSTPQELPRRAPDVTDSYPTQRDQGASLAVSFFTELNTSKLYLLTN
ncbi:hypothetical protein U9M48_044212 [Paspalum notatum var. saurae]|uniref:Aminotransferase-like plant mobile domain-containing protein n=1 Tax=Paspalum notatum var. saurae TaxID=547442 RepID=A0AAQ3UUG4_PASNO